MIYLLSNIFSNKQLNSVAESSSFKKSVSFILKYGPIFMSLYLTYFLWYNWQFLIFVPLLSYKKCMFVYILMNLFQTQNLNGDINKDDNEKSQNELYYFIEQNYIDKVDKSNIDLYEQFKKNNKEQVNDLNEKYMKGHYWEMFMVIMNMSKLMNL